MNSDDLELLDELIDAVKAWDDRRYDLKWEIIHTFALNEDVEALPDDIQAAVDLMTDVAESVHRVEALEQRRETAVICDDADEDDGQGGEKGEGNDEVGAQAGADDVDEANEAELEGWLASHPHMEAQVAEARKRRAARAEELGGKNALREEFVATMMASGIKPEEVRCILLEKALVDLVSATQRIREHCAELDRKDVPPELMSELRSELGGVVSIRSGFSPIRAQAAISSIQSAIWRAASA
jgi:hypothetical protein